jgi:hypothetical protein
MKNRVKLRGHHLICLNFFQGEGYSKEFVINLKSVLKKAKENMALVVEGADDVCFFCPHLKKGRCSYKPQAEKEIKRLDELALKLLKIRKGDLVNFNKISSFLPQILSFWKEKACLDCDWKKVCEKVW